MNSSIGFMSTSNLLSRRNTGVNLKSRLQIDTRRGQLPQIIKVEKKIEYLKVEMKDLVVKLLVIHDGGEQCRVDRVRSKEDGKVNRSSTLRRSPSLARLIDSAH